MRKTATENGISVKAYAGTTGILLAMNIEPTRRKGLLGFALERLDSYSGEKEWLNRIFWYCVATLTLKMGARMRFAGEAV